MYIARFRNDDLKKQMLKDHVLNVVKASSVFAKKVNLEATLKLIGLLHDMGKYSDEFQNFISKQYSRAVKDMDEYLYKPERSGFDHGVYGAKYIFERVSKDNPLKKNVSEILALIIGYHHGGLPDCEDENGKIVLLERLKKIENVELDKVAERFFEEISEDLEMLFDEACKEISIFFSSLKNITGREFLINLIVKVLYSMLIDADRLDAMCFDMHEDIECYLEKEKSGKDIWEEYSAKLEKYLIFLNESKEKAENLEVRVKDVRRQISDECMETAGAVEDVFWLTVPTGGGKTLSSMRFALNHNRIRGKERIIYVIPYTSIIEQNAAAVRKALFYECDLLEHHSNVLEDNKSEDYKLLTERWDSAIVFTTMVQFLNTFYSAGTQNMRRLHHLMNATVIFDEVQTVPVKCMYLFNSAINFLRLLGNSTIVLSSATQPNLDKVDIPVILQRGRRELIKDVAEKFSELKRVEVVNCIGEKKYNIEQAVAFILEKKIMARSLLVVLNKVISAELIYQELKKRTDIKIILLTSYFCPVHRGDILRELYDDLERERDVILISTCLIEAGIDISFDAAIRNLTKMDSIIQTAGRVNRNGKLKKGFCYVIDMEEGDYSNMPEVKIGGIHTNEIFSMCGDEDVISQQWIEQYFIEYFGDREIEKQFNYPINGGKNNLYTMLSVSRRNIRRENSGNPEFGLWIRFSDAARKFCVIDQDMYTLIVPYADGIVHMNEIESANAYTSLAERKRLLERAKKYSISVYSYQLEKLKKAGAVTYNEVLGVYLLGSGNYSAEKGLLFETIVESYML